MMEGCERMGKVFLTIRETAKTGLLSEYALRLLEAQGRLPGIYVGRKKLVNVPLLRQQLERESLEGVER